MSGTPQIAGGASETVRRAAARRAGRTAVVTFAAFSIGRGGAESVPVAVFATFTGLAITGIADFGGPMRGRVGAIAVTVTAGFALTALGTSISTQGVVAGCLMTFCVVAAIALMGLLGGYAVAWSNASILFYVVAIGSPAPVSAIAERLHGVALGGVLALLATVWLWPEQADTQVRHQLAQTRDGLARRLSRIIEQPERRPTTRPVTVRSDLAVLVDRPVAPTGIQRAELYLLNDLERLEGLIGRLETGRPPNRLARTGLASCASGPGVGAKRVSSRKRNGRRIPARSRCKRCLRRIGIQRAHTARVRYPCSTAPHSWSARLATGRRNRRWTPERDGRPSDRQAGERICTMARCD